MLLLALLSSTNQIPFRECHYCFWRLLWRRRNTNIESFTTGETDGFMPDPVTALMQ